MSKTASKPQSIMTKISKIGMELSKIYEDFLTEKHNYLNHKRIVEYLFNKPLEKTLSYYDLTLINYDSSVKSVRLELENDTELDNHLVPMNKFLSDYSSEYETYEKYTKIYELQYNKSFNRLIKFDYLPIESKLSLPEKNIMHILDRIEKAMKYKFHYVYKWNFMTEGENTSLFKLPTVNYQQSFIYDFYGITMWRNQLAQFVILFDDDSHFDSSIKDFVKIHRDDIMKQYMLYQMNIHLLRLNKRSDLKKEIISFVRKIRNSTEYVTEGKIKPIARLFQSKDIIDELVLFRQDYEYNHVIYLKTPTKKHPKYDSDDDEFFDNQSIKDNYSETAADAGVVVTTDVFNKIIRFKENFHPPNKLTHNEKRANEIIVELKRENGEELSDILNEKEAAAILKFVFNN